MFQPARIEIICNYHSHLKTIFESAFFNMTNHLSPWVPERRPGDYLVTRLPEKKAQFFSKHPGGFGRLTFCDLSFEAKMLRGVVLYDFFMGHFGPANGCF